MTTLESIIIARTIRKASREGDLTKEGLEGIVGQFASILAANDATPDELAKFIDVCFHGDIYEPRRA